MSPVTDGFRSQQSSSTVTRLRLPPRTQSEQNLVEMQQECPVVHAAPVSMFSTGLISIIS